MDRYAHITNISQIRPLVEANDESFYIAEKDGYSVANYKSVMATFPDLATGDDAYILRELRGIIFCNKTGDILRRPLHKFFNYGERAEYHADIMAQKKIVAVYDKLDGSMIAPFILDGEVRWGTKMGLTHMTPDVEAFVERNPRYGDFVQSCNAFKVTPIFEYMAPKHRIVVNHAAETMVLLAVRDMITGEYMPYGDIEDFGAHFEIPVVRRWEIDDNFDLVNQVRELEGAEGVVVEFDDGTRAKVKSLWYMDLHKNREAIAKEKYVVGLILNDRVDDALSLVPDHVQEPLKAYTAQFLQTYADALEAVWIELTKAFNKYNDKRTFAIETAKTLSPLARSIGFKCYDVQDFTAHYIEERFRERILNLTTKSDTDFEKECRQGIFNNSLPAWNIWEGGIAEG